MLRLLKKYPELLLFGVVTAAFSSPGQTFLISLFIPHMREAFDMSKTQIASYYSAATLASALIIPWTGRILDRAHLMTFTLGAGILLALGCFVLSQAQGVIAIFLGFLLVRNLGQGTLTMISSTTMARIFGSSRGKALGISNLGYPIGEALFPFLLQFWIMSHGWRSGWVFSASAVIFFFMPMVYFLLRRDPHEKAQADIAKRIEQQTEGARPMGLAPARLDWTMRDIMRDKRFYLILIPGLMPPTFFTALFFYQISFFEWKAWDLTWVSVAFVAFGISRGTISFLAGPMIDRYSAKKIFPFILYPLALGLLCFLGGTHGAWSIAYLIFAGMTLGLSMTVGGALFAELYGTKLLGSIRGLTGSLVVFSTAVAPLGVGALLDAGISPAAIFKGMIYLIFIGSAVAWFGCKK